MEIMKVIKNNMEFFETPSPYCEWVEVTNGKEEIYMPSSCAFNCIVLALKDTKYNGIVSIVHKRDSWVSDHEIVHYASYQLVNGKVVEVDRNGSYACYAERKVA